MGAAKGKLGRRRSVALPSMTGAFTFGHFSLDSPSLEANLSGVCREGVSSEWRLDKT